MNDRGEFRPIYVALVDGPDFQVLSGQARWTFVTLKLTLGAVGIGVVPGLEQSLAERTGWAPAEVPSLLQELERGAWIERERNIVWIVRGLDFEPNLSSADPKHRKFVQSTIASLPRLAIVSRFRERYSAWFSLASEGPSIAPSEGLRSTEPPPPQNQNQKPLVGTAREAQPPAVVVAKAANAGLRKAIGSSADTSPLLASQATQQVEVWLQAGIPLELIVETVESAAERFKPQGRNNRISSFSYFDNPVRRAHEATTVKPESESERTARLVSEARARERQTA